MREKEGGGGGGGGGGLRLWCKTQSPEGYKGTSRAQPWGGRIQIFFLLDYIFSRSYVAILI